MVLTLGFGFALRTTPKHQQPRTTGRVARAPSVALFLSDDLFVPGSGRMPASTPSRTRSSVSSPSFASVSLVPPDSPSPFAGTFLLSAARARVHLLATGALLHGAANRLARCRLCGVHSRDGPQRRVVVLVEPAPRVCATLLVSHLDALLTLGDVDLREGEDEGVYARRGRGAQPLLTLILLVSGAHICTFGLALNLSF
jgi:hypothetical protein